MVEMYGVTDKLNVVLAAEVAGYGRLVAEDADEARHQLMGCRALFEDCAHQHRGRILDAADGRILADFANGVDALCCALEIQDGLHARNESFEPNRQMHFRIGVGEDGTVATRLDQLALAGGVCISRGVRDQVEGQMPALFKDIGQQTVEGDESVQAFIVERKSPERTVKAVAPRPHRRSIDAGHNGTRAWLVGAVGLACLLFAAAWALLSFDFGRTATAPEPASRTLESRHAPAVGEGLASKPKASSPEPSTPAVEAAAPGDSPPEVAKSAAVEGAAAIKPEPAAAAAGASDLARSQSSDQGARDGGLGCLRYIPEASLSVWVPCGSADHQPSNSRVATPVREDFRQAPAAAPPPPRGGPKEALDRKRRPQNCAEIIERAQLGELSNQDRTYLQTQCR